jgi:hypothetical protein
MAPKERTNPMNVKEYLCTLEVQAQGQFGSWNHCKSLHCLASKIQHFPIKIELILTSMSWKEKTVIQQKSIKLAEIQ